MATNYKTLLVAPQTDLDYAPDEVNSVVNLLHPELLGSRRATLTGLTDALASGFDIVWFATHGDSTGIWLTDGISPTSELTTLIRATGARLCVFNTCSSYEVARSIFREVQCDFVCTIKEVPDRMAFVTGTVFAQQLAQGLPAYEAYLLAKPGDNTTYEYFRSGVAIMPTSYNRPGRPDEELDSVKDSLRRIEAIVSGNPQWNVYGLVPEVRDLRLKVDQLIADVMAMRANQLFNRRLLIGLSIICCGLLVMLMVLLTQRGAL